MGYFETSRDILNIVLAVSIAAVAFFICWLLFYLAVSFRKIYRMVDDASKMIRALKEKVENFSAYFLLIGEGIKKILEMMKDAQKGERKKKKEEQPEEDDE